MDGGDIIYDSFKDGIVYFICKEHAQVVQVQQQL